VIRNNCVYAHCKDPSTFRCSISVCSSPDCNIFVLSSFLLKRNSGPKMTFRVKSVLKTSVQHSRPTGHAAAADGEKTTRASIPGATVRHQLPRTLPRPCHDQRFAALLSAGWYGRGVVRQQRIRFFAGRIITDLALYWLHYNGSDSMLGTLERTWLYAEHITKKQNIFSKSCSTVYVAQAIAWKII